MDFFYGLIAGVLVGGVLSWLYAKKVYGLGEVAYMTAKGYLKRGEDWVKGKL